MKTLELEDSHANQVEHDIRPNMPCVVTLPVIIDGMDSGVVVYVTASMFKPVDESLVSKVAEEIAVRVNK